MAIREVVRYPDPRLKAPAAPLQSGPDPDLARDLVDTMRAGPATVGLAAPQIGRPVRAFALDVSGHPRGGASHGLVVVFDPELLEADGEETRREGCLSVPDLTADVARATRIVLGGIDPSGAPLVLAMEGFEARAAQHELDHLGGMLILDRVAAASRLFPRRVYR